MYPAGVAGMALYSYKLGNALAEQGILVTQFVEDKYELERLPAKFFKERVLSGRYAGTNSNQRPAWRMLSIFGAYCYNAYRFYSGVKKDCPEVVHLQSFLFYPVEWYLINRLKARDCKIVLTVHNIVPYKFYCHRLRRLELAILGYIYNGADKLIVHSEMNKRQLLANFEVDKAKVLVIPHGEYGLGDICGDISVREARVRLNLRRNSRVILFFGYIRRIKGLDVLLRAFEQIAGDFPDAVLVIAGSPSEGESFGPYRDIMAGMEYGDRVMCFVEYIRTEDIPLFFLSTDIVVLPYTEFSAQSGVLHMAQGFGKAVITSDVGGLPEANEKDKTGIIVPAGDVKSLADAMHCLLANEDMRTRMGNRARELAAETFSWNAIARSTMEKAYLQT